MAKTVTLPEEVIMPSSGKWYWKEDTNTLEFQASTNLAIDPKDKKGHRKKNITFNDHPGKKDRAPSGRYDVDRGQGKGPARQGLTSKSARSKATKETTVTLQRVKSVVLSSLIEVNIQTHSFEMCLFELNQFDEFLLGLLNYFSSFFEQIVLESKPKTMTTEPSQAEKKAMAEIKAYMEAAQRKLAKSYCVLILGLGLPEHHHMGCGSDRVSSTYKDRELYETLYRFCVHLVWIVFRRKEYELINKEMGRMLRSDVFNPALRIKNIPEDEEDDVKGQEAIDADHLNKKLLSPAEYRRKKPKRPAITQIINQRSPVLVSLLPTPKEEHDYLFERMTLDSTGSNANASQGDEGGPKIKLNHKVGIIGEPLNQFNPMTLAPLGSEQDEENDDDQGKTNSQFGTPSPDHGGLTRQHTDMSQATTEVFSDDDDDDIDM
ncbi:protein phosphatase 1 regulatory subunit 36-like isoform X2 [Patiria miniata]|uniref:Protein phosphatase 1 regulatory subunit 36 n=1 Tax=Patiria miniata TaxID=46514 RepID=A0A914BH68_PATMI|nr:protein phosphatase 1 regulatory subunit 36-like isoform X2 [Patiria miniata]